MNINAQNAYIEELNDAQIQEIKAQRKIFGGIIKKGDPLYKNIINLILFAFLLPCMIIFELAMGVKNLLIRFLESLITLKNSIVHAYRCSKEFFISTYYFLSNWIIKIWCRLINQIKYGLTTCLAYIALKLQQVKMFIIFYSQLFIKNFIIFPEKWIIQKKPFKLNENETFTIYKIHNRLNQISNYQDKVNLNYHLQSYYLSERLMQLISICLLVLYQKNIQFIL
ncbi:unnamed protein product [Paramecium sonneborni]|uniref:Transmembrane protein n=1 Tax=Paramecium sonneborni TaxID=65129 RepID=A0A8S1RKF3_9CILI|nr:unnamed protein product [Paramecium sonneborni]